MKRKGFTLIELLIVVAIIAILAAIAIPQFAHLMRKSENARRRKQGLAPLPDPYVQVEQTAPVVTAKIVHVLVDGHEVAVNCSQ